MSTLVLILNIAEAVTLPFWKAKPAVLNSIVEEREVVVSVTHDKKVGDSSKTGFSYKGAGLVRAPFQFCQKTMLNFEKLVDISDYIRSVKFYPEKDELFFHGVAFNYHAIMWMKVNIESKAEIFSMNFEVLGGHLTGMKAKIMVEDYKRQSSLISIDGSHAAENLGMPAKLLDYGLEIVLQQVAKKIRNYLEAEFKKEPVGAG